MPESKTNTKMSLLGEALFTISYPITGMSREELARASEVLQSAADEVDGAASERLVEQARQLADLAERERGPDHGRLDRHQEALRDVKADVEEGAAERIGEAIDLIAEYRESVPGV